MVSSSRCTVVMRGGAWIPPGDGPELARCGKPVVGKRWVFPMCVEHMALFAPDEAADLAENAGEMTP